MSDPSGVVAPALADTADDAPTLAAPTPEAGGFRRTALIVATALFMQNLDSTVLATALPTMARDFGVAPANMGLALTAYLLALACFIPASGFVADRFGARKVFAAAIALFTCGSIACGLSNGLEALIAARFAQGMGGAMMVPVGRLVLLRSTPKRDLVSAMSWLVMPALIGPILGPPVGGLIVTFLEWRWIFWINVPMGGVGVLLVTCFIPSIAQPERRSFDALGLLLSSLCLAPLLFGLQLVARASHGLVAEGLIGAGIAFGLFFVGHARRRAAPILDLTLFAVPTFRWATIGGTLVRIMQGAQPFLLPMMMQLGFGFSAATSGSVTVATALGSFGMKSAARRILKRFGFRTALTGVGLLAPLAYMVTGLFRPGWPAAALFAVLLVCGFLTSFQFTAYNTLAYSDIESERMSRATSLYATFQQLSLSLGVASASGALTLAMRVHRHARPGFVDFHAATLTVTAIALTAFLLNRRIAPDAGAEVSGHRAR